MNEPIRRPGDAPPGVVDPRIGGLRQPQEVDRVSGRGARRFRDKIPTLADLEALIQNGRLILPPRYFRGYYLDLFA